MAEYRIVYWKHIPTMVIATDNGRQVRVALPPRFQAAVDAYAVSDGSASDAAYSAGFHKGEWQQRDGTPEEVAQTVAAELEAAHLTIPIPKRNGSPPNSND